MSRTSDGRFDFAQTDISPVRLAIAKSELRKLCAKPVEQLTREESRWVMRLWREQTEWALPILKGT
jgi:hypothetical protein